MAAIVARAEVIGKSSPEGKRNVKIFKENAIFAICATHCDRLRGDVFRDPGRVAGAAIVGACEWKRCDVVCYWARKAILKETFWIDERRREGGSSSEDWRAR